MTPTPYTLNKLPESLRGINKISGWLSEHEALWLHKQAATRPRILEIGCWKGRSTFALCTACPGQVWSVDHFQGTAGEDAFWYNNASAGDFDGVRRACLTNLKRFLESGKLVLFDMRVEDFYALYPYVFKHHQFDMVWIDGAHDEASVSIDIMQGKKLLAPNGLLCGHDAQHKGVNSALKRLVPNHSIHIPETMLNRTTSIWYVS